MHPVALLFAFVLGVAYCLELDPYEVLDIPKTATLKDIKSAYRKQAPSALITPITIINLHNPTNPHLDTN